MRIFGGIFHAMLHDDRIKWYPVGKQVLKLVPVYRDHAVIRSCMQIDHSLPEVRFCRNLARCPVQIPEMVRQVIVCRISAIPPLQVHAYRPRSPADPVDPEMLLLCEKQPDHPG